MVEVAVILQSVIQLARFSSDMAEILERATNGEAISEAEWADLRRRLDAANAAWETA